jgi:acetoin utilization deacetylase AcuC-like enzyme
MLNLGCVFLRPGDCPVWRLILCAGLGDLRYTNPCVSIMKNNKPEVYCTFQEAPAHHFPGHPEAPKRIHSLGDWLENPPYPEISWLEFSPAKESELMLVHDQALLAFLREECQKGAHEFEPSPTYVTVDSYQAALGAVGATLAVSRRILSEGTGYGFAIVRPPGHHAERDASMGFCLLNNIAVAAADAVASGLERVAIVDLDAHHGNGTQAIFWETPEVGYLSTHEGDIYPGTGGQASAGHARGRIINLPLPSFSGDQAYEQIFDQIVSPWLEGFQPEMIFVSAGYDAHFSDPLTTLTLSTQGYHRLTSRLVSSAEALCEGRLMFVLEGGYDPLGLADNLQACLAAMTGHEDFPDHYGEGPGVRPNINPILTTVKQIHQF